MSPISHFSCVVPNLSRQFYKNFESVYKISRISTLNIFPSATFMTISMSNPCAISYSSTAKIMHFTYLLFIKDQCILFSLLVALARQII